MQPVLTLIRVNWVDPATEVDSMGAKSSAFVDDLLEGCQVSLHVADFRIDDMVSG